MTSSLVGSEMCIRDSPKEARRARSAGALPLLHLRGVQLTPSSSTVRFAVSYTHLTLPTICSV
eukprot:5364624-Prorocentrum_lima.AAC.1